MMLTDFVEKIYRGMRYLVAPFEYPQHFGLLCSTLIKDRLLLHELARLQGQRRWFKKMGFKTLVDVGANTGAFSFALRMMLPDCQIYAFEPLPDIFELLEQNLSPLGNFSAFCSAIGAQRGQVHFYRSNQSASSSILLMAETHREAFPDTAQLTKVTVPLASLDDYLVNIQITHPFLLKMDVQGYEDKVIEGGAGLLVKADYVLTEVSYRPMYEGQVLFEDIYNSLKKLGFNFAGNFDALFSPFDGSILQSDALFIRNR
jgi:FkbM family methyltransferase